MEPTIASGAVQYSDIAIWGWGAGMTALTILREVNTRLKEKNEKFEAEAIENLIGSIRDLASVVDRLKDDFHEHKTDIPKNYPSIAAMERAFERYGKESNEKLDLVLRILDARSAK